MARESEQPMPQVITFVLLPGMEGTGELFSEFVAALPDGCKAVVVRYPADRPLSYSSFENFVLGACPASEPFVLLGESFSAPLAIRYAATMPVHLAGVILCAGFAVGPLKTWRYLVASLLAPLLFHFPLTNFATRFWLVGPNPLPSTVEAVKRAISSIEPKVLALRLRAVLECDARADLKRVVVPILYIQAKQDRLVSVESLEEIRRIKPAVKIVSLEGPHLILQCRPQAAAEAAVTFARSCRAYLATSDAG